MLQATLLYISIYYILFYALLNLTYSTIVPRLCESGDGQQMENIKVEKVDHKFMHTYSDLLIHKLWKITI